MTFQNTQNFDSMVELTVAEIDDVDGGIAFIVLAPVIGKVIGYTAAAVAGAAAGVAVTKAGVEAARAIEG